MENIDKELKPLQKIILFGFVSSLMNLPQEIRKLVILNLGFEMKFLRVFILIIFMLYIIHLNYFKRNFKAPHLISFLLFTISYYFIESLPYREVNNYRFIILYSEIYILFLLLVNFGDKKIVFYKVIDYALYSGLIFCFIYWVGHLGLIDVQTEALSLGEVLYERRTAVLTYQNIIAYFCAFTILLLIIKQLNENKFTILYLCRDICYIFLLNGMIILQASRGGALLSMPLTIFYVVILIKYGLKKKKGRKILSIMIILPVLVLLFFTAVPFIGKLVSQTYFFSRVNRMEGTDDRYLYMINAWNNFKDSPLIGVGYEKAAIRGYIGTRSNNEYFQMLASVGVFGFVAYVYFAFRLVAFRIRLLKIPEVALCVFFYAISQLLERPMNFVAIMGYIAFYFAFNNKYNLLRDLNRRTNKLNRT